MVDQRLKKPELSIFYIHQCRKMDVEPTPEGTALINYIQKNTMGNYRAEYIMGEEGTEAAMIRDIVFKYQKLFK